MRFFTGHVTSWGVLENRSGDPTSIVTTDCRGEPEGSDGVHMIQQLEQGNTHTTRDWHLRRVSATHFTATANDVVGTAEGDVAGRAYHWTFTLALEPGNALENVTMSQWWYALDDGSMLNRTTISKLGITLAEVSEHFQPTPARQ